VAKAPIDLTEGTVSSEQVYKGALLDVRRDVARMPDGSTAPREWINHPGAVAIVACTDEGRIVLERQHRYPLHVDLIEIPAGKIDAGEDPLATARRELREETGYTAARWTHLTTMHPLCAYSNERIEIYLAEGLTLESARLDEGEFLEVFTATLEEALGWIEAGKISDSKTIIGLFWLDRMLRKSRA
jgi:ADP-ribose pyrophosphatase